MTYLLYFLIIYPLSRLPLPILYIFSSLLSFLLKTFGYRKKSIYRNLKNSFPDKSEKEIASIANKFYSHFTDIWMETLKAFSISKNEISKRLIVRNPEFLDKYLGRDVIAVLGHYNNWELDAVGIPPYIPKFQHLALYTPVNDPFLNQKVLESRQKYGMKMVSRKKAKKNLTLDGNKSTIVYLVADQSALTSKKVYWMPFLNQETAVVTGPERFAKMYDRPVVFLHTTKTKRGHYEIEFSEITDNPSEMLDGEITVRHVKMLEQKIKENPEFWLWSHNRWKKGRTETNAMKYDFKKVIEKINEEKV